jgi:prepilin-type N-terminal cleavage/methylation domain-containing protein
MIVKMTHAASERGFSLIEVLVSISIFLITAGGLAASTIAAIKANTVSRDISVATTLVQEKIEFFRALDPSRAADQARMVSGTDTVNDTATAGTRYTRTWTVTNDSPKYAMATVTVMVEWSGPERRSLDAVTYVCRLASCA